MKKLICNWKSCQARTVVTVTIVKLPNKCQIFIFVNKLVTILHKGIKNSVEEGNLDQVF